MKKTDPFIVFGPSKSGTTWLQRLLDTHPEVRCHFQLPMFRMVGDKQLFVEGKGVLNLNKNPFGGVFKDEAAGKKYFARQTYFTHIQKTLEHRAAELKAQNTIDESTINQWHQDSIKAIFSTLLYDTEDKKIFGNKAYTNLDTFFKVFPEGKVINILRDGRDVCVSRRFHTFRMGAYYHGDERSQWLNLINSHPFSRKITRKLHHKFGWFGEKYYKNAEDKPLFGEGSLTKFAKDWALITEYILEWQQKRPDQILMVRYEALKTQPEAEIERVLDFIGADKTEAVIESVIQQNSFSKLKKAQGKKSFFRKGIVGDWKNHFTEKDIQLFKELTGDLLVRLAYETDENWT